MNTPSQDLKQDLLTYLIMLSRAIVIKKVSDEIALLSGSESPDAAMPVSDDQIDAAIKKVAAEPLTKDSWYLKIVSTPELQVQMVKKLEIAFLSAQLAHDFAPISEIVSRRASGDLFIVDNALVSALRAVPEPIPPKKENRTQFFMSCLQIYENIVFAEKSTQKGEMILEQFTSWTKQMLNITGSLCRTNQPVMQIQQIDANLKKRGRGYELDGTRQKSLVRSAGKLTWQHLIDAQNYSEMRALSVTIGLGRKAASQKQDAQQLGLEFVGQFFGWVKSRRDFLASDGKQQRPNGQGSKESLLENLLPVTGLSEDRALRLLSDKLQEMKKMALERHSPGRRERASAAR